MDPLYLQNLESQGCHALTDIAEFMGETGWNYEIMEDHLPKTIVEHVKQNMNYFRQGTNNDRPWWTKSSKGLFNVRSAWEIVRCKEDYNAELDRIWMKGLPFKISFFGWRLWTSRVPVAAVMAKWNSSVSQNCGWCAVADREIIEHLFLKGEIAAKV